MSDIHSIFPVHFLHLPQRPTERARVIVMASESFQLNIALNSMSLKQKHLGLTNHIMALI